MTGEAFLNGSVHCMAAVDAQFVKKRAGQVVAAALTLLSVGNARGKTGSASKFINRTVIVRAIFGALKSANVAPSQRVPWPTHPDYPVDLSTEAANPNFAGKAAAESVVATTVAGVEEAMAACVGEAVTAGITSAAPATAAGVAGTVAYWAQCIPAMEEATACLLRNNRAA